MALFGFNFSHKIQKQKQFYLFRGQNLEYIYRLLSEQNRKTIQNKSLIYLENVVEIQTILMFYGLYIKMAALFNLKFSHFFVIWKKNCNSSGQNLCQDWIFIFCSREIRTCQRSAGISNGVWWRHLPLEKYRQIVRALRWRKLKLVSKFVFHFLTMLLVNQVLD